MLGNPSTMPDSDFVSVLTSTDCSNSEVFVHVGLQYKILLVILFAITSLCLDLHFPHISE